MDDPYTRPDEDPFSSHSVLQHLHERRSKHERSSLLGSWPCEYGLGSSSNPYLAYPDLPRLPARHRTDSCSSYDLIEHDDIPHDFDCPVPARSFISRFSPPSRRSSDSLPRPSFSSSTSSFSAIYLPTMSTSTLDSDSPATPTKSRLSFFRSRSPKDISKVTDPTHTLSDITDVDNDDDNNIDNLDFLPPPSNRFSRASSHTSASASSLHLPSSSQSHLPISKRERDKVYLSSLTRSGKKKRKLIIGGIGATELRKLEGVKRWCETFGELRSITRLPNGDLQIDFRDPEVAESVCRIRAKVFIAGVGSVQLSWIMGNKR